MANEFSLLSTINPKDKSTWEDKIFLTFDIEWAHDTIISDLMEIISLYSIPVTFYATHQTDVFDETIKSDEKIEIGIHPNFNPLFDNSGSKLDLRGICSNLKDIFPNATSFRSHSLVFGSPLQPILRELSISHDSSVMIPFQENNFSISPWVMWDRLIRVPHFFCDYVTASSSDEGFSSLYKRPGLKVFDFHPIHVFLNTENVGRYERTRLIHHDPRKLLGERYTGYGTRNLLIELLESSKK